MANERRGSGFFGGFVIGATIGAAIAIALTREDARDALLGKAREATNFAKDATEDLRGKVSDVRDRVADAAAQWQTNASDLYERGRDVMNDARADFGSPETAADRERDRFRDELHFNADE